MDKAKQSCKEFQKIAATLGLSTSELMENLEQLQKPDLKMDIKKYEYGEAKEWLNNKNENHNSAHVLAEYGRRLYNQAINDAVNTIANSDISNKDNILAKVQFDQTRKFIIERIKKLER